MQLDTVVDLPLCPQCGGWRQKKKLKTKDDKLMSSAFSIFELWGLVRAFNLEAEKLQTFIFTVQEILVGSVHCADPSLA